MQPSFQYTTFKEVKHLFPQKTWAYWRNEKHGGEFEDEVIAFVDGDLELDNLNLDAPQLAFHNRFKDYETYLKQESCFIILIKGSLRAKNIFNEETDGSTGLVVLGDVETDNIVVG